MANEGIIGSRKGFYKNDGEFWSGRRVGILVACIVGFPLLLAGSVLLGLALPFFLFFPIDIFIWAIVWTLYAFDWIFFATGRYFILHRLICAAISGFNVWAFFSTFLGGLSWLSEGFGRTQILIIGANLLGCALSLTYAVLVSISLIKWLAPRLRAKWQARKALKEGVK